MPKRLVAGAATATTLIGLLIAVPVSPAAAAGIDTNNDSAVAAAWDAIEAGQPGMGFTGNTSTCTEGTTSQAYRTSALNSLNAFRGLAGIDPATEDPTLTATAQGTALLMGANNNLSHKPPTTWNCYTAARAAGAGQSNLAAGAAGSEALSLYMSDSGLPDVGHRRWMICPNLTKYGFGDVSYSTGYRLASALTMNMTEGAAWNVRDGNFVAWPYPGKVPVARADAGGLLEYGSLQIAPGGGFTNPTVTITSSTGSPVTATVESSDAPAAASYCSPAVTWSTSRKPTVGEIWTTTVTGGTSGTITYQTNYGLSGFGLAPTPTISGTAKVGSTLTANPGSWSPSITPSYQWFADGVAITGATSSTLTLGTAQLGKAITVQTTGAATGYQTTTRTSAATSAVAPAELVPPSTVSYSGTPVVGGSLTANPGAWGPSPVTLLVEWLRDGVVVGTGNSYSPTAVDANHQLSIKVTGSKTGYASASVTSASQAVGAGTLSISGNPTIQGASTVGSTLVATAGTSTPTANIWFTWLRDGVPIVGAAGSQFTQYTLTAADTGAQISVKVEYSAPGYSSALRTSAATTPVQGQLTATDPIISGTPAIGQTLIATASGWDPSPVNFSYQWFSNGTAIAGATSSTLVVPSSAGGTTLTVQVTGSKSGYASASRVSAPTTVVPLATFDTPAAPMVTGATAVGSTLQVSAGTWAPEPAQSYSYQWLRDGVAISGATGSSYLLTTADAKATITVKVTGKRTGYADLTVTSNAVTVGNLGAVYVPISACRVADTRQSSALSPNAQRDLQVSGSGSAFSSQGGHSDGCGIPSNAKAVAATLFATAPSGSGWAKVWPTGQPVPNATFLNYAASASIGNSGAIPVSATGKVTVKNFNGTSNYVLDVQGYYVDQSDLPTGVTGSVYVPTQPCRVVDTRVTGGALTGTETRKYRITGTSAQIAAQGGKAGGCAIPDGAGAVTATVTAVNPRGTGFARAWIASDPEPNATFLNYAGASIGNTGSVPLAAGTGDQLALKNIGASSDFVIDVQGYFMPAADLPTGVKGSLFAPLTPCRVVDTRNAGGPFKAGDQRDLQLTGSTGFTGQGGARTGCGVAAEAVAVESTVTALSPTNFGWSKVWPAGSELPNSTFLNFAANRSVGNTGAVTVGTGGKISLRNFNASAGYVIDVQGVYLPAG